MSEHDTAPKFSSVGSRETTRLLDSALAKLDADEQAELTRIVDTFVEGVRSDEPEARMGPTTGLEIAAVLGIFLNQNG